MINVNDPGPRKLRCIVNGVEVEAIQWRAYNLKQVADFLSEECYEVGNFGYDLDVVADDGGFTVYFMEWIVRRDDVLSHCSTMLLGQLYEEIK